MTFLSPLFLIGISAAALPLLIHLIFKKKAKVLLFPSIIFLKEINREVVRRKRLEEIIVMILRMLVLILLSLFLSKPVLKTNLFSAGSKAIVVLLDDSFSMNASKGGARFEVAKERARLLIASLSRGDTAALLLTSKSPEEGFKKGILSGDRPGMTRWLETVECGFSTSNLDVAFAHARTLLHESGTRNRGIFLISDLQRRDWRSIANREKTEDIPAVLIDVGGESIPLNVALTDVTILTSPEKRLGRTFTFRALAKNFSAEDFEGRIGMRSLDGKTIAETSIAIPAESSVEKEVRFHPAGKGLYSGYFLIEKDDLPTDNKCYYSLEVKEGIPIGIFNQIRLTPPDFDEVFFLKKLIDPTGQGYPFAPDDVFVISRETLDRNAVVIFPNVLKLREGEMSALNDYVASGGRAIFFLQESFSPETLRGLFGDIASTGSFEEGRFKVGDSGFGMESLFLDVDVFRRLPLSLGEESQIVPISLFQDEKPLLVEKRVRAGRLLLFSTGYHLDYTNLPLRHASLPFMYNLLFRLVGKSEPSRYVVDGAVIARPDWESLTTPEGEIVELGSAGTLYKLRTPGVYEAKPRGNAADTLPVQFSVNLNNEEGDLTPMVSEAEIEKIVPFSEWERVSSEKDLRVKLQTLISGTPLGAFFLYGAILMFLAELYLANKIGQKV
jgi:hypothetical protein